MRAFRFVVLSISFFCSQSSIAQVSRDSLLANERTLDRPLNVHGGQLRITGEYDFSYFNYAYDNSGKSTKLKKEGLARARHYGYLNFKYGILEFLQLSAQLGYQTQTVREQQILIVGFPDLDSNTSITSLTKVSGLEDVAVGIDFRFPLKTRKIDILTSVAVLFSIVDHEQPQPENTLTTSTQFWEIQYNNQTPISSGVTLYRFGGALKYRSTRWGFTMIGDYTMPSNETTQKTWSTQLNDQLQFEYQSTQYAVTLPNQIRLDGMVEFQTSPYFNVFVGGSLLRSNNGWFEWEGENIKIDEQSLISLGLGFELIITPRIWFRETLLIPVSGKNIDAGVQFRSLLSYNLFLKK